MCSSGSPLFSFDDNSTRDIIERLEKFRFAYEPYHGYLCVVICTFGIVTNLINVIVLTKRQMRTSINVLLTGIACCDMGTMASYLIYIVHFVFANQLCNPFLYSYAWLLFLLCHIIVSVALHTTGLWLAVVMAFIRNMTLQRALNGSKWLRSTNTWKICIFVYLCVFILCVPSIFSSAIAADPTYFNRTCPLIDEDALIADYERRYAIYTVTIPDSNCVIFTITLWLTGTLFKIIPCILLALLIISLLWTIKKAERRRRALFDTSTNRARIRQRQQQQLPASQTQARSDRTTTMLVVILGLFLATELPQGAISILSGIYVEDMRTYVYPNLGDILDLLSLINSSVNFVLYCAMSSKYRQVFWQVVLPRSLYINWFLRPRVNDGCYTQRRDSPPAPSSKSSPVRAELQALASLANRVEDHDGDRETSILDLYRKDEGPIASEHSATSVSSPTSPIYAVNRKKTIDTNLRRQVLTRAAVLAASPSFLRTKTIAQSEIIEITENRVDEKSVRIGRESNQETSNRRAGLFKNRWLISCSCLCKCALRGSGALDAAALEQCKSNLLKSPEMEMTLIKNDGAEIQPATETDPLRPGGDFCLSPERLSYSRKTEYFVV